MRLMGGVFASVRNVQWVRVSEQPDGIAIAYQEQQAPVMTPDEARCVAAQLLSAADRIEAEEAK